MTIERSTLKIQFDYTPSVAPERLKILKIEPNTDLRVKATANDTIIRWLNVDEPSPAAIVVTHTRDAWLIDEASMKITLLGTISEATLKQLLKLRKGSPFSLSCSESLFEWLNPSAGDSTFKGKCLSAYDLGERPLRTYLCNQL
jgi:hypothetical protein